jgi:hypothetical protein
MHEDSWYVYNTITNHLICITILSVRHAVIQLEAELKILYVIKGLWHLVCARAYQIPGKHCLLSPHHEPIPSCQAISPNNPSCQFQKLEPLNESQKFVT